MEKFEEIREMPPEIQGGKDVRFGNPEERVEFWKSRFSAAYADKERQAYADEREKTRKFLEKDIDSLLPASVVKSKEYWYRGSTVHRFYEHLMGMFFGNEWRVKVRLDTSFGSEITDMCRRLSDDYTDWVNRDDVQEEFGKCLEEYLMAGWGTMCNIPEMGSINRRTGHPFINTESVPSSELLFAAGSKKMGRLEHVFRHRLMTKSAIEYIHPEAGEIRSDIAEGGEGERKIGEEGKVNYYEVEFQAYGRYPIYVIDAELAGLFLAEPNFGGGNMNPLGGNFDSGGGEVNRALGYEDFVLLTEKLKRAAAVAPRKTGDWILAKLKNTEVNYYNDLGWYGDKYCNERSLYAKPLPLIHDRSVNPQHGFSYKMARYMNREGSLYPRGIIYLLGDEIILFIIFLTIMTRAAVKYTGNMIIINTSVAIDEAEKIAEAWRRGDDLVAAQLGDDINKAIKVIRSEEFSTNFLALANWITNRLEGESGVRKEVSGSAPYAGSPASLTAMLMTAAGKQMVPKAMKFSGMCSQLIRQRMLIERELGIIPREFPIERVEAAIDIRGKEERDAEALKWQGLVSSGLVGVERLYDALGIIGGAEEMQSVSDQRMMQWLRQTNPELLMQIQTLFESGVKGNGGRSKAGARV